MKLLVPNDIHLDIDVPDGVAVVPYDPSAVIPAEHLDADAMVSWGFADQAQRDQAVGMPNLRWVQALAAGPDSILAAGLGPQVTITTGRGFHDRTVAEHALALALAGVRRFPLVLDNHAAHRWDRSLFDSPELRPEGRLTSLIGASVLVWGFGSIGTTLAPLLEAVGATVAGVARSAGTRDGYRVVAEADIEAELGRTDVLVMILPTAPDTTKALNARRLAALPPTSWVVNVGRGSTVDEDALLAALREGRIAGAALDVTAAESLPADSPLWDAPNLIITPHVAGGRPLGAGELTSRNLRKLLAGEPLDNAVAR